MAGLCEGCSYVGAVLFAVEAGVRIRDTTTCTQEKNKWLLPSHVREIAYLPVSEIDVTSAKKKHELMVEKRVTPRATRSNPGIQNTRTPAPTSEEQKSFFTSISGSTVKPAKPAKSLVKSICYPEARKFATAATRWGCEHEGRAHKAYQIEIN